jgi:hypothetical protein
MGYASIAVGVMLEPTCGMGANWVADRWSADFPYGTRRLLRPLRCGAARSCHSRPPA